MRIAFLALLLSTPAVASTNYQTIPNLNVLGASIFSGTSNFTGLISGGSASFSSTVTSPSFSTNAANGASAGTLRLINTGLISWRNAANGADLPFSVNGSDILTYNAHLLFNSSGILQSGAFPALTGDVTTSAGSLAATLAATTNSTLTTLSGLTTAAALSTVGAITSGTWNAGAVTASGAVSSGSDLSIAGGSISGLALMKTTNVAVAAIAGYGVDAGHQNGGTQTYAIAAGADGLGLLEDTSDGFICLFLISAGGGTVTIVSDPATAYSTVANTADRFSITISSGTVTVRNNAASGAKNIRMFFVRIR